MKQKYSSSVFKVYSRDPDNSNYGTGFIIHKDDRSTYFLTCAHVVKMVGGETSVCILNRPALVEAMSPSEYPDLAVLKIDEVFDADCLELGDDSKVDDPFVLWGCKPDKKKISYGIKKVSGKLGQQESKASVIDCQRFDTYELKIESRKGLQDGYSGSPVFNVRTKLVTGIATNRETKDNYGSMIAANAISHIWTGMPKKLLDRSVCAGEIRSKMCNRKRQDSKFKKFFEKNLRKYPHSPQFYFLPGRLDSRHESFIKRVIAHHVTTQFGKNAKPLERMILFEEPNADLSMAKNELVGNVCHGLKEKAVDASYGLQALCKDTNLGLHPVVILKHKITAKKWNSGTQKLLKWYIFKYFHSHKWSGKEPIFLLFFNVILPGEKGTSLYERIEWYLFKRFLLFYNLKKLTGNFLSITAVLKQIFRQGKDSTQVKNRCLLIDELNFIDLDQLDYWFDKYGEEFKDKKAKIIDELFESQIKIPMEIIEKKLYEIVHEAEQAEIIGE